MRREVVAERVGRHAFRDIALSGHVHKWPCSIVEPFVGVFSRIHIGMCSDVPKCIQEEKFVGTVCRVSTFYFYPLCSSCRCGESKYEIYRRVERRRIICRSSRVTLARRRLHRNSNDSRFITGAALFWVVAIVGRAVHGVCR